MHLFCWERFRAQAHAHAHGHTFLRGPLMRPFCNLSAPRSNIVRRQSAHASSPDESHTGWRGDHVHTACLVILSLYACVSVHGYNMHVCVVVSARMRDLQPFNDRMGWHMGTRWAWKLHRTRAAYIPTP